MSTLLRQAMDGHRQPIVNPVSLERRQLEQEIEDVRQEQDLDALSFEHDMACCAQEELTFAIEQIEAVQASVADQTLSHTAQKATTCALESIDEALGSLDLTMESEVSETIQKIWRAIKDAFRRALDAVVNFISRIFGGIDRLKKKVAQTRDKIELMQTNNQDLPRDLSGVQGNAATFQTSRVHRLYLDGELTQEQLAHGARSVIYNLYPDAHGDLTSLHDLYLQSLLTFSDPEKIDDMEQHGQQLMSQLSGLIRKQMTEIKLIKRVRKNSGFILNNPTLQIFKLGTLPTLPGGYQAFMYIEKGANIPVPILSPIELHRVGDKEKKNDDANNPATNYLPAVNIKKPRTNEGPILNLEQSGALLEVVDKFIEKMEENRPVREELLKKRKQLFEALDDNVSSGSKELDKMSKLDKTVMKIHMRRVQKDHLKGLLKLDRYVFNYTRHLIGYIDESLDALASRTAA